MQFAMVMWILFICVLEGVSMRLKEDGFDSLVEQLKGTSKEKQCNFLANHSPELVKDESMYEFVVDIFVEAQQGHADDTSVLQCLADRLEKNLSIRDNLSRETLLFPAVLMKRVESAKYLLDCEVPMDVRSKYGFNVVETAVMTNCTNCLTLFLERGADPNERFAKRCTDREIESDNCKDGWSLAHWAVFKSSVVSLHILSQHKANLSARDDEGLSLVHTAILYLSLDMLLELGKLNASFNILDKNGRTPAHLVCQRVDPNSEEAPRYFEIIQGCGGSIEARDAMNETPAHTCAMYENQKALEYLHAHATKSFEVLNLDNQKPADIADQEENGARLFFAKLKAQAKTEEVNETLKENRRLLDLATSMAEKCKDLTKQVGVFFDCRVSDQGIRVPEGVMMMNGAICSGFKEPCAARCPNDLACRQHVVLLKSEMVSQCENGYDEKSAGCSRCASGYGRLRQDPFQCRGCGGPSWLSWVGYIGKPMGIYAISLWTAQKVERDQMASLLKIWMAFAVVVASTSPSIRSSDAFAKAHAALFVADTAGAGMGSLGSQLSGPSFDCLLHNANASISGWLLLSFAPSVLFWLLTMIYMTWRSFWAQGAGMDANELMKDALKVSIVITNCFLPDMVAGLVRFFPCVHFHAAQDITSDITKFLQFQVETPCSDVFWMRWGTILAAFLLGSLLGPVYWVNVIKKSEEWKDREIILGFLISGYRKEVCWWEATVLIRKCIIAVATTLFTVSYAPMLYLSSLLFVVGISLAGHAYVLPYKDPFLNKVEFGTLLAAFITVFCTFILKLEKLDWSVDDTVTIPAAVVLMIAVTVPPLILMSFYVSAMRMDNFVPIVERVRTITNA